MHGTINLSIGKFWIQTVGSEQISGSEYYHGKWLNILSEILKDFSTDQYLI